MCRGSMKDEYLKFPATESDWKAIATDFCNLWQFPNCLGAIDGKHFQIRPPSAAGSLYYNYKNQHSIVLMAISDANYKFIFTEVGTNGRVSDSGIWSRSVLRQRIEKGFLTIPSAAHLPNSHQSTEFCFIGNDAFPLSAYMQKPFAKTPLTQEEEYFNRRLSRARRVVENAFVILVNRFNIFLKPINLHPNKAVLLINTCLVLHNYLRQENISERAINLDANMQIPGNLPTFRGRNTDRGKEMRIILKNYFSNEGFIAH